MKMEISKEWCLRMARLEGASEIGAGLNALDPTFEGEAFVSEVSKDETSIIFGRFIRLMRRSKGMSLERLSEDTDIDIAELIEIEEDTRHKPGLRAVHQLANFFNVPQTNLLQIAGLTSSRDKRIVDQAVRFAARSESIAVLTSEEKAALEAFVAVLSEQK